jgi:hypothetical protein
VAGLSASEYMRWELTRNSLALTRMPHYDENGHPKPPKLMPGERRIIAQFQDECCFHATNEKGTAWLRDGEQPLRKKGRGRLIHVSDFINEEDGRLVIRDGNGAIIRDARKIIYPGGSKKGDVWWDCEQLIVQTKEAIDIFDEAHPDCQALFIFDNSTANGSLGSDSLKALR